MSNNIFNLRTAPWSGLGTELSGQKTSRESLITADLDWDVVQQDLVTESGVKIPGYKANIRETDKKVLGVVTNKYQVIQNRECYAFLDNLAGEGTRYILAGNLYGGKRTFIVAKMPQTYVVAGDEITPYLVCMNSHDGSSGVRIFISPLRIVCANMLNFALSQAKRCWSAQHTGSIDKKLLDAHETLFNANRYMSELGREVYELSHKTFTDKRALGYIDELFQVPDDATESQIKNIQKQKEDMKIRYFDAPDLQEMGHNAYRLLLAASDHATHVAPLRAREGYQESMFSKSVAGHELIDRTYNMMKAA